MKLKIVLVLLIMLLLFCSCAGVKSNEGSDTQSTNDTSEGGGSGATNAGSSSNTDSLTNEPSQSTNSGSNDESTQGSSSNSTQSSNTNTSTNEPSHGTNNGSGTNESGGSYDEEIGDDLDNSEIFDGYFENEDSDITVSCVSGTPNAYSIEDGVITISSLDTDSVYSISGNFKGSIVIDIGHDYKLDLELCSLNLVSDLSSPITVLSGEKVSITAKNGHESYIYDTRKAVDKNDENAYSAAIYSLVDLELCGKGALTVVSTANNGIHSKKDLDIKNLTLRVTCTDNALKGNDSVSIKSGDITLIATQGDGIKTTNSDISSKGNQRGIISVLGGNLTIYACCDGIDAAYDVIVDGDETAINIYTDKYSSYSDLVTDTTESLYYVRYTSKTYSYAFEYYNSESDYVMVNAEYHSSVSGGRSTYYYYSVPKMSGYSKIKVYIYTSSMTQGDRNNYYSCTEYLTPNDSYDTFALSARGNSLSYSWTNYTTKVENGGFGGGGFGGGFGGMNEGNSEKGDHSTKGIKAANSIEISNGVIYIKSYDDAIHAGSDTALENGSNPLGDIVINGASIEIYSNDDGVHADNILTVNAGSVNVTNSYEGLEGYNIVINGGSVSVISRDDGINAGAKQGTGIAINGGYVYVYATGDGIDSNSQSSYSGIAFTGGTTVVISTSSMNSAIDSEQGYLYTGGTVLAIMSSGGMVNESTHCSNFSSKGSKINCSASQGGYIGISIGKEVIVSVKMPCSISGVAIYLGSSSASVNTSVQNGTYDSNGVYWK